MRIVTVATLFLSLCSFSLYAANTSTPITQAERNSVNRAIDKISKQAGKKLPVTDISRSPVPGLLQVTSDMSIFYITPDGEYLFFGDILDLNKDKSSWSITDQATRALRAQALAAVSTKDMIIYPSTASKKIGNATIFTDIDCPYCHKLQENIKEYTDAGIEIRYLAFPRSGPKTKSFEEAIKVWCAPDKAKAYSDAIALKEYPKDTCKNNPVMMEYELGQKMGINGTPTIVLDDGTKVGGLVDAKTLVKIIKDAQKN